MYAIRGEAVDDVIDSDPHCTGTVLQNLSLLEQERPFCESDFAKISPTQKQVGLSLSRSSRSSISRIIWAFQMDIVEYSSSYVLYEKFFKYNHDMDLLEPMLRKLTARHTPGKTGPSRSPAG